jgi:hypothetical protein
LTERSEVQWGTTNLPFLVRRSDRRKTVALSVEGGQLVVTAPEGVAIDRLNAIVRAKARWAAQRIKRASDLPPPPSAREFLDGETVLYLGRQLRLQVIEQPEGHHPVMRAGRYQVPIPPGLQGGGCGLEVRRRLLASLKEHAQLYLPDRLGEVCRIHGLEKPPILVREQKKRWGSCNAQGTLRINWRIIQAPISLIDYVLAHELVHREHLRHGPAFWAALGSMMPDYETRRSALREMGRRLEW